METSPKSKVIKVRADSLLVHPSAQRDIVPSKLKKLIAHLDLDAIGVLHVVETRIDGKRGLFIIDGQHRWNALMHHGCGEWLVEVKVHLDADTQAAACDLFLKLNDRAPVSPYDKYIAEVKAGHPDAVAVNSVAEKLGLRVSRQSGDARLACPAALKKISRLGVLFETLEMITTTFGTKAAALEGRLIEGAAILLKGMNGELDKPALIKKLQKYPGGASGILGDAKGRMRLERTPMARCVAQQMIDSYNQGRRIGRIQL